MKDLKESLIGYIKEAQKQGYKLDRFGGAWKNKSQPLCLLAVVIMEEIPGDIYDAKIPQELFDYHSKASEKLKISRVEVVNLERGFMFGRPINEYEKLGDSLRYFI